MGKPRPVGSHGVFTGYRPDGQNVFIGPLISHNSHALDRQKNGKRLPQLAVEISRADLIHENYVGFAQDGQTFFRDLPDDADSQTRTWEGLTPDLLIGHAELLAQQPDFVLEEVFEGLHQGKTHLFRKAAYIVV